MKTIHKITALLLVMVLFTGCGAGKESSDDQVINNDPDSAEEVQELTVEEEFELETGETEEIGGF